MARRIFLMRHAAAAGGAEDLLSALAPEGREAARAAGRVLARLRDPSAPVLTSAAARCRATATVIAAAAGGAAPVVREELREDSPFGALLALAAEAPDGALLVGHQPPLAALLEALAGSTAFAFTRTASLAVVELSEGPDGRGRPWLLAAPDALHALA